uniref:Immunoglobulin V-set domain-containing protein n=1 Tax=Sinocyclocheilus grahami TaxID=75366 RepID=A0A672K8M9_SINGR
MSSNCKVPTFNQQHQQDLSIFVAVTKMRKISKKRFVEKTKTSLTPVFFPGAFIKKDEIKSVLVRVGESVTLHTDVTEIQEDELIRWKFADSNVNKQAEFSVIAKWDKTKTEENLYNEERFKDRLQLDHNTGSLTIRKITPKHFGQYKLQIISEGQKISKTFNVAPVSIGRDFQLS